MNDQLQNVKGTQDFLPDQQRLRDEIRQVMERNFRQYGYQPIETPILNNFDLLASKYAGGAEILKEVYQLSDRGDRALGLRYDLTVPFAKVVGMNPSLRMPFKRYEIGKTFRDGPVKTGRSREFIQCDVDVVGIGSVMAEVELIELALAVFRELEMPVSVTVNNRKLLSGLLRLAGVPAEKRNDVILVLDKRAKIGESGVRKELLERRLSNALIDEVLRILGSVGQDPKALEEIDSSDPLLIEGIVEMSRLLEALEALGLSDQVRFDPSLARGLDIYTGTVYEFFQVGGTISSSVASGGRYDRIIGEFLGDGKTYPAVGLSLGLDVIYSALQVREGRARKPPVDLYLIPLGTTIASLKLARELRDAGIRVDVDLTVRKIGKSFRYANKEGIPFVLVLGEDELTSGLMTVKEMTTGDEQVVERAVLVDFMSERVGKQKRY